MKCMVKDMMTNLIHKRFDEEKASHINSQREMLYAFDKELVSYTATYPNGLRWFFAVVALVALMVPYQALVEEVSFTVWIIAMICCWPTHFGDRASVMVYDDPMKPQVSVYKKLRCLPIDKKVWIGVKLEYALQFSLKFCMIAMIEQIVMTLLVYKAWSWASVIYPLVATLVIPMLFMYLELSLNVKNCEAK